MRQISRKMDLTQGSIFRLVLLFALPLCIGNILQQLYSTVDTLVISNFCGTVSLAAIGTSSQPVEILLCLFIGIGNGVSILVANLSGAKDQNGLLQVIRNASTFLYVCALPVMLAGFILGPTILRIMQVPEDTMSAAVSYLQIMFIGTLPIMGFNTNSGILRGLGDSSSSLLFLVISCLTNIFLDLLFVAGFGWDVVGAAWATVIAQMLSWLVSAWYLSRHYPDTEFTLRPQRMEKKTIEEIIRIGLPLGLNHSLYSVGHVVVQLLINTQGSVLMAACSIASKINAVAHIAISSLASAATTFSGQNQGAGKLDRLRQGAWQIPALSGCITLCFGIVTYLFAGSILSVFHPAQDVLALAIRYLHVICPFFWAYAVFNAMICYVNGMGIIRYPTIANLIMLWGVRIPVAAYIVFCIDGTYVMAAYSISFVVGMLTMIGYYFTPAWKKHVNGQ